jgi:UDP-glucose 4-epimerase
MILITGGGGFIGLNLAKYLVDQGQQVLLVRRHAFDVPSFLAPDVGKQVFIAQGDISEPAVLYFLLKTHKVESVIHAAVVTESSAGSSLYQALKVNLQGTIDLLEAARTFELKRITFLSSVSVYNPPRPNLKTLSEDSDLSAAPGEWISGSKKAGEQICQLYVREYGMSVPIVRPPQVWGPLYWTHRSPVHTMIENAISGKPSDFSHIYGGNKTPFSYVRDCARALGLIHLAPSLKYNIYNIADSQSHSLADFAQAIKEVVPAARIKLGESRPPSLIELPPMSIERLQFETGFIPQYSLKQAVQAYIAWLKDGEYI